jgi:uncharacterized protein with ParB-like and HNH nuclease domain/predicted transport protein
MKATEANLLEFLKKSPQFVIPIYQRTYSWTDRECLQLWNDIIRTGSRENISTHFIGSVVYIEKGLFHVSSQSPLVVIDGQQRLTTLSLVLEALARRLGDSEPVEGFSAKKLRHYYLLNPLESDERGFKLILTQTDKDSLLSLMQQKHYPREHSIRIKENFEFFQEKIALLGDNLEPLCKGLAKLVIVDIALTRDQDNPQLIFESMNSTGLELSQADLIRNFILMDLEPKHQTNLYQDHWRPMEKEFGQEAYGSHFDRFMRHYLTIKTGEIPNIDKVYDSFKTYSRATDIAALGVDALVADIHTYATYYCRVVLGGEPVKKLSEAFQDLREFKVDVAYPFLLELYNDYSQDILNESDLYQAVRLIESYVFRRAICNIPTNSLNKTFATLGRALNKEHYLESIQANLILLPSYRRFPDDAEFKRNLKIRNLYNFPRCSYWLRRMENFGRKERVPVSEYTIEHILPQNDDLSLEWRNELGPDWERVRETWLHTLGNLTLTGYNSEYSDRPFQEKKTMGGGFKDSPLKLNEGLGDVQTWNEEAIQARAEKLANLAHKVWVIPNLEQEILALYKRKTERTVGITYTIEDHANLSPNSPMRPVFEAFRKEVLALDPVINEEFLKLYVAYKAETNFVDVVPLVGRLRLTLNMDFHEIDDPRGKCKDVTHLGRWGNGNVEIGLDSINELPYIMGLVRQSFEKQMGNGENG